MSPAARLHALLLALAAGFAPVARADGPPPAPARDVRPAIAFAEARLAAAHDEPARRSEHLHAAAVRLEAEVASGPADAALLVALSRVRLLLNRPPEAWDAAARAVETAPADVRARLAAAEVALRLDDPRAALAHLDAALESSPAAPLAADALVLRARARLRRENVSGAVEDARAAAKIAGGRADVQALERWCALRAEAPLLEPGGGIAGAHFLVRSEVGFDAAKRGAARLVEVETRLAGVVPLRAAPVRRVPVHLLSPASFEPLAVDGRKGARAFYQRDEAAVFVIAEKPLEMDRLVSHEATHALLHRAVEEAPAWLDEGLADWVAGDPHPVRCRDLQLLIDSGRDVRFADLAARSRREMYDADGLHLRFAAAWGWVSYLAAKERARLDRYTGTVLAGGSAREAFAAGFGDADVAALEKEWRGYVMGLKVPE